MAYFCNKATIFNIILLCAQYKHDFLCSIFNKISTNSDEIVDVKSALEGLKKTVPAQTEILNSIEEKFDEQQERLAYFEKQISKLGGLEDKFEEPTFAEEAKETDNPKGKYSW